MRYLKTGPFYLLRLERGEDIPTAVAGFVKKKALKSGVITGLGAARRVVLGYFDLKHGKYRQRRFEGEYEIASITGNIAWHGREPVCHMHAVISGPGMATRAGHLFAGLVAATCEIAILPGTKKASRAREQRTGLKLLDLPSRG